MTGKRVEFCTHVCVSRLNMKYCTFKCHQGKQFKHKNHGVKGLSWMYCCPVMFNRYHTAALEKSVQLEIFFFYSVNYNGVVTGLSFLSSDFSFCLCFSSQHFQLKKDSDIWVGLDSFEKKKSFSISENVLC